MRNSTRLSNAFRFAGVGLIALGGSATAASAGAFQINEQSTVLLGSASAGAAAGGNIGSMYYNPAATAQFSGLNTESSYTLVVPRADIHVDSIDGTPTGFSPFSNSGDIGIDALTSSSYATYQLSKDLWVGLAIDAPFGLATKPENTGYLGSVLGVTTKVLTVNVNPTLAYKIAPGVTIGAGIQVEYARGKLQFALAPGPFAPIAEVKGDDVSVGATAGILLEPFVGTSIGLGYRQGISHNLDGHFKVPGLVTSANADLNLPDLWTLSLRQTITPTTRLLGTVEWTRWSEFQNLPIQTPLGTQTLPTNWSDGWFFSIGGEYDYSPVLTLRTGVGYELTPEDSPSKVLTTDPDGNRVWLNIGASYKWSETVTLDVGYSHIFVESGDFVRSPIGAPDVFTGTFDASADLFSVGMRTVW